MDNNAHSGESKAHRLKRLQDGAPNEAISTLLNSIANFFNNEIRVAPDNGQTSLMFLGIHASALTIAETFFGDGSVKGYKKFLEMFVDGDTEDTKFSLIAEYIHDWRNTLAHQWIGSIGHHIEYDYSASLGWERQDDIIVINPRIYCERYLGAFSGNGKLPDYRTLFTEEELEKAKAVIVRKYQNR